MISARFFLVIAIFIRLIYSLIIERIEDIQRKKPLPEEVSDVYDAERYQKFLDYTAESKKIDNKYRIYNILVQTFIFLSPLCMWFEKVTYYNTYLSILGLFVFLFMFETFFAVCASYSDTFGVKQKYGLNKKDIKEFIKDEILEHVFEFIVTIVLILIFAYIGENMKYWTNNYSVGLLKSIIICSVIFAVIFLLMTFFSFISYLVLRKQYTFTPLEGELRDKIDKLQEGSKKKVKEIYVYNESKKSVSKNAFLLKLLWHKEFGIADNFINENAEDELLAVLSHEIGHLKHKKNILNFISYGFIAVLMIFIVWMVNDPKLILGMNIWIKRSFQLTVNNYVLIFIVLSDIYTPISYLVGIFNSYRSKKEEYEADREAVKNGYGEALIKTFKTMSSDELINVNPHPFIEFTEYDHPGMYQRIKAIKAAEDELKGVSEL